MVSKRTLRYGRLAFGLLGLSAVVTEVAVLIGQERFVPANFFSFFTIESNIFAAGVLLYMTLGARKWPYAHIGFVRGAATLYMVITGIVFSVLLAGLDPGVLTAVPWDNTVLHYIMPIVMLVDWLLDPPRQYFGPKHVLLLLVYPMVYVAYSLVRGGLVGWYPYPFLNVEQSGWENVGATVVGISALSITLATALIAYSRYKNRAKN